MTPTPQPETPSLDPRLEARLNELTEGAFGRGQRAQAAAKQRYEEQTGQLYDLLSQADRRFAPSRQAQEQAVAALGLRAQGAGTSAAAQAVQAQREAAVAQASPQAILGGQIGAAQARSMGALEQEAAAKQAAYLRGVQGLGAGLMSEAEQRRAAEQEALRDIQVRFAAAQQFAASERDRQAAEAQKYLGAGLQLTSAVLGSI